MKKKLSTLLVAFLCLTMSVWALAGCGGSSSGEEAAAEPEAAGDVYTASEVTSDAAYADEVSKFYENVDMKYAYDLTHELAYNWDDYAEACGWRTAGSDSEHATADFLAAEMEKIGLQNVDKVGTICDKFQFNGSSMKIKGSKVDFKGGSIKDVEAGTNGPAAYQLNGTDGDLTAKIVDVGKGGEAEYKDAGFKEGDIAFVQVDQWDNVWINIAIKQAKLMGASALVTWANSGYGEAGTFTNNTQDVCCGGEWSIPTVSISADQAKKVRKAIKNGKDECTLNVDAELVDNGGITYNVCGMIPGKNHDQKIIVSGHYDKYWYGFQDDCAAIGLVFAVGKAMVDAGYEPENDIYFVCHGAEEWGVTDSVYDWTTGAWGMVDDKAFADNTIAMLNFELPAFDVNKKLSIFCVPEFSKLHKTILDSGIVVTAADEGILYKTEDTTTMEDGISYREYGTPYFLNGFEGTDFMCDNYHTIADNADTYSESLFNTNINWCGAYAIYVDNNPALPLDFTATAKRLNKAFNSEHAKEAGIDTVEYQAAVETLKDAGKALNKQVAEINDKYAKAVAKGDEEAIAAARAEGTELNLKSLEAFQKIQDDFLKVTDFGCDYGHTTEDMNVDIIDAVFAMIDAGEGEAWTDAEDGFCDLIINLNAAIDWNYYAFSKEVADDELLNHTQEYYADKDQAMWGWNHMPNYVKTGEASAILYGAEEEGIAGLSEDDIAKIKEVYGAAREESIGYIGDWCTKEIASMNAIAEMLK